MNFYKKKLAASTEKTNLLLVKGFYLPIRQLTRGAFIINDFLQNPHFKDISNQNKGKGSRQNRCIENVDNKMHYIFSFSFNDTTSC